jgi:hypothetical protein
MRIRLTDTQLKNFDGKEYVLHSVKHAWTESGTSQGFHRGKITVKGAEARIAYTRENFDYPMEAVFVLEDGEWKADEPLTNAAMEPVLKRIARERRMSEDEMVLRILEKAAKGPVRPNVWDPPR